MNGIRKSIVGIVAPEGFGYKFAGAGFLVHDYLILTYAHVADLSYEIDGRIFAQVQRPALVEVQRRRSDGRNLSIAAGPIRRN